MTQKQKTTDIQNKKTILKDAEDIKVPTKPIRRIKMTVAHSEAAVLTQKGTS